MEGGYQGIASAYPHHWCLLQSVLPLQINSLLTSGTRNDLSPLQALENIQRVSTITLNHQRVVSVSPFITTLKPLQKLIRGNLHVTMFYLFWTFKSFEKIIMPKDVFCLLKLKLRHLNNVAHKINISFANLR